APVLYYVCDSTPCSIEYVLEGAQVVAEQLGAWIVFLEERFIGVSRPFKELSPANLKFYTYDQILEDMRNFQEFLTKMKNLKGPWIAYGGSQSGTTATMYKIKHKKLVAVVASSAVLRLKVFIPEFDTNIGRAIGEKCRNLINSAVSYANGGFFSYLL